MDYKFWLVRNYLRLIRLSPTFFVVGIAVVGLIFPDQIKAIFTNHHRLVIPTTATILIVAGIVQVVLLWLVDVQAEKPDPGPLKEDAFLRLYKDSLIAAVSLLAYLPEFDEARREGAVLEILKILCAIAEAYKNDYSQRQHGFNVCLYVATPAEHTSQAKQDKAKPFMDKDRTSYSTFLELTHWAYAGEPVDPKQPEGPTHTKACVEVGLVLPVDDNKQYTTFGAPYAYLTKQVYWVNDVKNERMLKSLHGMRDQTVCTGVLSHFRNTTSFRSFISLPVYYGESKFGAVSIQTKLKYFYNPKNKTDQQMIVSMEPFLTILALLIAGQPVSTT